MLPQRRWRYEGEVARARHGIALWLRGGSQLQNSGGSAGRRLYRRALAPTDGGGCPEICFGNGHSRTVVDLVPFTGPERARTTVDQEQSYVAGGTSYAAASERE